MTTLIFECCLAPWMALTCYANETTSNQAGSASLSDATLPNMLQGHLTNYLRNCNQQIQIDKALELNSKKVSRSLLFGDGTDCAMISSERFALLYFQTRCNKVSIPILQAVVSGCIDTLIPTNRFIEHGVVPHKHVPLTLEVEHILKSKFAVTSLFATTQKMLTPNSPASKLIEEMRRKRTMSETITIENSTKFQFIFYSIPTQIENKCASTQLHSDLSVDDMTQQFEEASFIGITEADLGRKMLIKDNPTLKVYEEVDAMIEEIKSSATLAFKVFKLPHVELVQSWETIILGANLKQLILNCCKTMLNSASFHLELGNFLVLEGMPGTGKTSLAKSVFQKLAISKQKIDAYVPAIILEFSTGEIFSKYFGESPKKLLSLLSSVEQLLLRHPSSYVFLLVDELETIATSREKLVGNNEVSDGLRIVNILITYLDRLKVFPNLIIIATTNMLSSMDSAVVDRAVRVFKFGNPNVTEIEKILKLSLEKAVLKKGDIKELEVASLLQQIANFCYVCMHDGTL